MRYKYRTVNGIYIAKKVCRMRLIYLTMADDIKDRIRQRLEKLELSMRSASLNAGLSDAFIRNIITGKSASPRGINLTKLAHVLKTTETWLQNGNGPADAPAGFKPSSTTYVPLISWVSAGELSHQDAVEDFSFYPTVSASDLPDGDWIALRVDGPSMNKISPPDSIILVNRADKRLITNGCYVIADETGQATYKRYRPNDDPPFQPASYKNIPAPTLEGAITIIGRVRRSIIDM